MDYRVMYLKDKNGQLQGCAAIKIKQVGQDTLVMYRLSTINPLDTFNKEIARALAIVRCSEAPFSLRLHANPNMRNITHAVMTDIANDTHAPTRARKAARLWLRKSNSALSRIRNSVIPKSTHSFADMEQLNGSQPTTTLGDTL